MRGRSSSHTERIMRLLQLIFRTSWVRVESTEIQWCGKPRFSFLSLLPNKTVIIIIWEAKALEHSLNLSEGHIRCGNYCQFLTPQSCRKTDAAAKSEALLWWHLSGGSNRWWIIHIEKLLFLPNVKQQQEPLFAERTPKLFIQRHHNAVSDTVENTATQGALNIPLLGRV